MAKEDRDDLYDQICFYLINKNSYRNQHCIFILYLLDVFILEEQVLIKKIFAVFICCFVIFSALSLNSSTVSADESKWSDESIRASSYSNKDDNAKTIEITNAKELGLFAYEVNQGTTYEGYTVTLKNDIDLSEHNWDPIGHHTIGYIDSSTLLFRGTFDGEGHTIRNMNIDIPSVSDGNRTFGFFGGVLNGCVKNLNFENCDIKVGPSSDELSVGTVAGFFAGTEVSNITVKNSSLKVNSNSYISVGVLSGNLYSNGYIADRYSNLKNIVVSDITLSAVSDDEKRRGGIVGFSNEYASTISNCYAKNITFMENASQTENDCSGAIIGYDNGSDKEYCYYDKENTIIGMNGPYPGEAENTSKVTDGKLDTPVTIDGKTYDTLIAAMNAWIESNGGSSIFVK